MSKNRNSSSVLMQLYNNKSLRVKVDALIEEGRSLDFIIEFLAANDFTMSRGSLNNYKKKRQEAITSGQPLINLLDKRIKDDNVISIKSKESKSTLGESRYNNDTFAEAEDKEFNNEERLLHMQDFLEMIVQKSYNTVKGAEFVELPVGLKAMELLSKFQSSNKLISVHGLKQLRLRQHARETAILEVITRYIPEDKLDKVFEDIEQAEKEFYENLDLTAEDRALNKALEELDIQGNLNRLGGE